MPTDKEYSQPTMFAGPLVSILITMAIVVWFNFFPDTVGFYKTATDPGSFTPVLSTGFWDYLLMLDIWWGLSILLNISHILTGRWTLITRLADILISLYGISVLIAMAAGPSFIILPWLSTMVKVILGVTAVGLFVSVINQVLLGLKGMLKQSRA